MRAWENGDTSQGSADPGDLGGQLLLFGVPKRNRCDATVPADTSPHPTVASEA
jgi:hypothetical protein